MTMRFKPNTAITAADVVLKYLFEFLDFMRAASPTGPAWTISRSSDGTAGGAGDNIAAFGDLDQYNAGVSESWFVLRQPDGGREWLWFRVNATNTNWGLRYSRSGVFTGGDITAPPTAADQVTIHGTDIIHGVGNSVLHMGADDATPYGWFLYSNVSGDITNSQGMYSQIPITAGVQPAETDPMVFFYDAGGVGATQVALTAVSDTTTTASCRGSVAGQTAWKSMSALVQSANNGSTVVFPNVVDVDDNGDDIGMPITFCRPSSLAGPTGYKGVSEFVRWNGFARAAGETFASKTRISLGVANWPWDGTTTPASS